MGVSYAFEVLNIFSILLMLHKVGLHSSRRTEHLVLFPLIIQKYAKSKIVYIG